MIVSVFAGDTATLRQRSKRQPKDFPPVTMGDVWGTHDDVMRYLEEERASWRNWMLGRDPNASR